MARRQPIFAIGETSDTFVKPVIPPPPTPQPNSRAASFCRAARTLLRADAPKRCAPGWQPYRISVCRSHIDELMTRMQPHEI